jgi:WD40 repeat protein
MAIHKFALIGCLLGSVRLLAQTAPQTTVVAFDATHLQAVETIGDSPFRAPGAIEQAVISADGKLLLLRSECAVQVLDAATGKAVMGFSHCDYVFAAAWFSDAKQLLLSEKVSASKPGEIHHVDAMTGKILATFSQSHIVTALIPISDTQFAAGDVSGQVVIWDLNTGRQVRQLAGCTNWISCMSASADGQQLIACTTAAAGCVWNPSTGALLKKIDATFLPPNVLSPDALQPTPDASKTYVVLHDGSLYAYDGTRVVWSSPAVITPAAGGRGLVGIGASGPAPQFKITVSPDTNTVAIQEVSWRGLGLRFLNAADGKLLSKVDVNSDYNEFLGFSPDSSQYFVDMRGCLARFDLATGKKLFPLDDPSALTGPITHIIASKDNKTLFLGNRGAIRWSLENSRPEAVLDVPLNTIEEMDLSPDGRTLLVLPEYNPMTRVVDPRTMKEVDMLEPRHPFGPMHGPGSDGVDRYVWSDPGTHVATVGRGHPVLRDLLNSVDSDGQGQDYDEIVPTGFAGVAVSPIKSQTRLVLAFWNSLSGEQLAKIDVAALKPSTADDWNPRQLPIAFSGDNRFMLQPVEHTLQLYKSTAKSPSLPTEPGNAIDLQNQYAVKAIFHPDGIHYVALLGPSQFTSTEIVFGQVTPEGLSPLARFPGPAASLASAHGPESLAFSADGKTLYVGNRDGTISVYRGP